jgi:alkylation response protein AidB-like acyl-CoA dehydrogenase
MDFSLTDEQKLLHESVAKLMARHATAGQVRDHDRNQTFPYYLYDAWVEAGLLRLPFPEDYGGLGGSAIDLAIAVEEISRTSTDFCMAYGGTVFCTHNILRKGSDEQKRHWLPRVMSGDVKFSIGISEPDAGSDVGALRTFAHRKGDKWVIMAKSSGRPEPACEEV